MTVLPTAVAVRVVIVEVPPIFNVPVALLTTPPVPDKAVVAVKIPSFVRRIATPVTVNNVDTVKVPLFV